MATTATTTLTLVQEGSYGLIDVTVDALFIPSSDTSALTGTIDVQLEIDTDSDTVSALTTLNSDITGTQVKFKAGSGFYSYDVTSSETLGVSIFTSAPPGSVDPETGYFDASEHQFKIDEGTLTGTSNVDFAATPFGDENSGDGNLSLTLLSSDSTSKTYSVVMIYPVSTSTPLDVSGTAIDVVIVGTVKSVGTITVPLPSPFELWLDANSLAGASFEADSNQDGLPNGLQWALGLSAGESPQAHLLTFANSAPAAATTYTLELPAGGSAADLTILHAANLGTVFTPLAGAAVSVGNPIPAGTAGTVTITLPAGDQGFLKMSAANPAE